MSLISFSGVRRWSLFTLGGFLVAPSSLFILSMPAVVLATSSQNGITNSSEVCALAHRSYWSPRTFAFNNVASAVECRTLCQLNSPPIETLLHEGRRRSNDLLALALANQDTIDDPAEEFTAPEEDSESTSELTTVPTTMQPAGSPAECYPGFQCRGSSYSTISMRCTLVETTDVLVYAPFVESSNIFCMLPRTFYQTASKARCMSRALGQYSNIAVVSESSVKDVFRKDPVAPELPPIRKLINDSSYEATKNHLEEVSTTLGFRRNELQQMSFSYDNVGLFWGVSDGVDDWRQCAIYCLESSLCSYWTYVIRAVGNRGFKGGCYLKTSLESSFSLTGSSNKIFAITGSLMALASETALQKYFIESNGAREFENPMIKALKDLALTRAHIYNPMAKLASLGCLINGVVVHTEDGPVQSTILRASRNSTSLEECWNVCVDKQPDCVGIQWVPPVVQPLAQSLLVRGTGCLLFSRMHDGVLSFPFATVVRVGEQCPAERITALPIATHVPDANDREEASGCFRLTDGGHWVAGVSIRGVLLDKKNTVQDVYSAETCRKHCLNKPACIAFTWGTWNVCYLYRKVLDFRRDAKAQTHSGYVHDNVNKAVNWDRSVTGSDENMGASAIATMANRATYKEARLLQSCAIYELDVALVSAKTETLGDVASAQLCFEKCRTRQGCLAITWYTLSRDCDMHLAKPTNRDATSGPGTYVSVHSNCDTVGDLDVWSDNVVTNYLPIIIVGAIVFASLCLAGVMIVWFLVHRRHKRLDSSEPIYETSSDVCRVESVTVISA